MVKEANQLSKGDIVANVGLVDTVCRSGVFVIAAVRGTVWSLATGTGDVVTRDVVWHETETVVLDSVRD